MKHVITFESDRDVEPGVCVDCPWHYAILWPKEDESSTGCDLSGEPIPDDWDSENKPWPGCPIRKVEDLRSDE